MRPLFFSCVCDFCDGLVEQDYDRGFVVWRGRPTPAQEYVFPTREQAERWRAMQNLEKCPVLEVRAPVKFTWRKSTGTVKGIITADRLVHIYSDHRFPPRPNHAFLVDQLTATN